LGANFSVIVLTSHTSDNVRACCVASPRGEGAFVSLSNERSCAVYSKRQRLTADSEQEAGVRRRAALARLSRGRQPPLHLIFVRAIHALCSGVADGWGIMSELSLFVSPPVRRW